MISEARKKKFSPTIEKKLHTPMMQAIEEEGDVFTRLFASGKPKQRKTSNTLNRRQRQLTAITDLDDKGVLLKKPNTPKFCTVDK